MVVGTRLHLCIMKLQEQLFKTTRLCTQVGERVSNNLTNNKYTVDVLNNYKILLTQ